VLENPLFLPLLSDQEDKCSPLKNRIRKNYRHIRKWAKRTLTDCFRIYDRDIKEYPLAIDFYAGRFCVHFFSTDRENDEPRPCLKDEADQALFSLFGATPEIVYWRTRKRRAKTQQYEKVDEEGEFFIVHEYGVKFKINFSDYLDTGLFLDHRETRQMVAALSKNKKVLNLFAYTCSFSVHAAVGGASYTKSVDLSNTYTAWGKENFLINSISLKNNDIIRDDCLKFLKDELYARAKYDIIIVDPPTVSRSKKMDQLFDIQVDYISLLNDSLKLLSPTGCIFFSTNSRKFVFDTTLFEHCQVKDISEKTIPLDFHNHKIHRCWVIKI
jgi:23S rRNA G2069 N7-methylase RlmK/C1962 C5-methylase RlmI